MTDAEMQAAADMRTSAFGGGGGAAGPQGAPPAGAAPAGGGVAAGSTTANAGNNLPFSDILVG